MKKKRQYHRNNCDNMVRNIITDKYGRTIIMSGQHAFEWTIAICAFSVTTIYKYPNGKEARKEFNKYKSKR